MPNMFRYLFLMAFARTFISAWDFSPIPPFTSEYSQPSVAVNIVPSQTQILDGNLTGSYWSSSFLTDIQGKQYFVLSHTLLTLTHGSILDLDELSYTSFYYPTPNTTVPLPTSSKELSISFPNWTLEALTPDNVSKLRTTSTYINSVLGTTMGFNLTWTADHPVLYNMATGTFPFGPGLANEWGMPSGRTEGSLIINNKEVTLDPSRSFTWYDRQWGSGPETGNWTWYELHFPNDVKASVWAWDNATPPQAARFATLLYPTGQTEIVPVEWTTNTSKTWTSPDSGIVYPQEWEINFLGGTDREGGGGSVTVTSILGPQELIANKGDPVSAYTYEGFVTVSGNFNNIQLDGKNAFGLVEMERFVGS